MSLKDEKKQCSIGQLYNKYVDIVTSTMVDPQASRMHTAKKTLSGCGGNEGNTNELITVTWKTKQG